MSERLGIAHVPKADDVRAILAENERLRGALEIVANSHWVELDPLALREMARRALGQNSDR